jgi:hypothetical protein
MCHKNWCFRLVPDFILSGSKMPKKLLKYSVSARFKVFFIVFPFLPFFLSKKDPLDALSLHKPVPYRAARARFAAEILCPFGVARSTIRHWLVQALFSILTFGRAKQIASEAGR